MRKMKATTMTEATQERESAHLAEYERLKALAANKFEEKKWVEASKYYNDAAAAAAAIYSKGDEDPTRKGYYVICKSNSAQSCMNFDNFKGAIQYSTDALSIDPKNKKALYRRGVSWLELSQMGASKDDLKDGKPSKEIFCGDISAFADLEICFMSDPDNTEMNEHLRKVATRQLAGCCIVGSREGAARMLEYGADVNTRYRNGEGPLWVASSGGFADVVELLLSKGAKASLHVRKVDQHTNMSTSCLMAAASGFESSRGPLPNTNHVRVLDLLISHGADVNEKNRQGVGPVSMAADSGFTDRVEMLLSKGANINEKSNQGISPIIFASTNGHLDCLKLLLSRGANTYHRMISGKSALSVAKNKKTKLLLGNWGVTMVIIVLQMLRVLSILESGDASLFHALKQYIG